VNPYRPAPYQLGRQAGTIPAVSNAYEIAKAGGKHAGLVNNYIDLPIPMIERGIRSLERQIANHQGWIKNPMSKLPPGLDQRRVEHLINKKWPEDIARLETERDVLRGLLEERNR
jgi:hypothetical protein